MLKPLELEDRAGAYRRVGQMSTSPGARTSLFMPDRKMAESLGIICQ